MTKYPKMPEIRRFCGYCEKEMPMHYGLTEAGNLTYNCDVCGSKVGYEHLTALTLVEFKEVRDALVQFEEERYEEALERPNKLTKSAHSKATKLLKIIEEVIQ